MKSIYILLTRSRSIISRLIGCFTAEPYTHVSLIFEDELPKMYSFARKYARLPLPGGLVEERLDKGFYKLQGDIPCELLHIRVSDSAYYKAKNRVEDMYERRADYKYSVFGLLLCKFSIPFEFPNQYFCSQFVGKIIADSGIASLPKPPALMHPCDFLGLSGISVIYSGGTVTLRELIKLNMEILTSSATVIA